MKTTQTVSPHADAALQLNSRAVVALTGLSYLCVGLGFSYLHRGHGSFGLESFMWLTWALLGFGAGILHAKKPVASGQIQWVVLACLGLVFALFVGFAMYRALLWICLTLMIVLGARAATLRTRRDFYLTLTVIFTVTFVVITHGNADWTLWFYLGPAWMFGGLALAWDHAAGVPVSRWAKMAMTLGFIGVSFWLAVLLFFFAPRPPILGFGFLPPGTDTPGLFQQSTDTGANPPTQGNSDASGAGTGSATGAGQGSAGAPQPGEGAQRWGAMLKDMRQSSGDRSIPQWQRSLMEKLLDAAQAVLAMLSGQPTESAGTQSAMGQAEAPSERTSFKVNWLLLLALLLAGYVLWRRRYRLGLSMALGCSWLLAAHFPAQSMRVSAQAMKWCLHNHGHKRSPGQSVREHWVSAAGIAPLARRWLGRAVDTYCEMRFGGVSANRMRALTMRRDVQGACDIMMGFAPELSGAGARP